jgi:myosin-3
MRACIPPFIIVGSLWHSRNIPFLSQLSDFGVAEVLRDASAHKHGSVGTAYWMSPEMCATDLPGGSKYDARCDVWSLGITAIELAEGRPPLSVSLSFPFTLIICSASVIVTYLYIHLLPFSHLSILLTDLAIRAPTLQSISAVKAMSQIPARPPPTFATPSSWTPVFQDFVAKCLVKDYTKRKGALAMLTHAFISQLTPQAMAQGKRVLVGCRHFAQQRLSRMLEEGDDSGRGTVPPSPTAHRLAVDDNLATASEVTEVSMREQLKRRFLAREIYTYVGDILVAINPFAPVPLYDDKTAEFYGIASSRANSLRPHIFAVALRAFRALVENKENQAVIISGESGAGKTENAKYFIAHLLELSKADGESTGEYRYVALRKPRHPRPLNCTVNYTTRASKLYAFKLTPFCGGGRAGTTCLNSR